MFFIIPKTNTASSRGYKYCDYSILFSQRKTKENEEFQMYVNECVTMNLVYIKKSLLHQ